MKKLAPLSEPKNKKNFLKRFLVVFSVLCFLAIIFFVYSVFNKTSSVVKFDFFQDPLKSTDDRVNVLLLGNAGGKHDGADLTDSILVASYHRKTHQAVMFSIPRDLWMEKAKAKINTLYEEGESDNGKGLEYAEKEIGDLLGLTIHYGVRINFAGFAQAVDEIGGIEVDVPRTFDDYFYPIAGKESEMCGYEYTEKELSEDELKALHIPTPLPSHLEFMGPDPLTPGKKKVLLDPEGKVATEEARFECRYEHIHFNKGLTKMDGTTALKFVRSRHGLNGEGSDFARSRRQQIVLQAFRSKVISLGTLANPQKMIALADVLGKNSETDIPVERFLDFYNLVKDMEKVDSVVLGDLGNNESLFVNPPPTDYYGAWVLTPEGNDYGIVRKFVQSQINPTPAPESSKTP